MPRIARVAPGGFVYHVFNRANGGLRLFRKEADFLAFEEVMLQAHQRHPIQILAWCIMFNHCDAEGHIADTAANRQLLEDVANDPNSTLGTDQFGNTWSARTQADGSQVWTQTRNGQVINGGVNQPPRVFNPQTGLSAPTKPGT